MNWNQASVIYLACTVGYFGYRATTTLTLREELVEFTRKNDTTAEFFGDRVIVVAVLFLDLLLALVWPFSVAMDVRSWIREALHRCDDPDCKYNLPWWKR